ncbi:ATP-binding protein [Nonomuraea endophytica]|uniref:ATP-binding protein n=1 Tax=Nonomuraea endophytica TaxID=714136 RepID=UPI0037C791A4
MNARQWRWLSRIPRSLTKPAIARTGSWRLTRSAISADTALHLTRDCLLDWKLGAHGRVFEVLVGELVTNARGTIRLTLFYEEGLLRCAVEDDAPQGGGEQELYLVSQLSCCWGSTCTPAGKAIWFELPIQPHS